MFDVQKTPCSTCIYRADNPLNTKELEDQIADEYGGFKSYRQCHHTDEVSACCAGFWTRHKDSFQLGQIAQRLNMVCFVERNELDEPV